MNLLISVKSRHHCQASGRRDSFHLIKIKWIFLKHNFAEQMLTKMKLLMWCLTSSAQMKTIKSNYSTSTSSWSLFVFLNFLSGINLIGFCSSLVGWLIPRVRGSFTVRMFLHPCLDVRNRVGWGLCRRGLCRCSTASLSYSQSKTEDCQNIKLGLADAVTWLLTKTVTTLTSHWLRAWRLN